MNTVIVPVDFSETSLHAAKYAANMLKGYYGVTMILYNSYSKASEAEQIQSNLNAIKEQLQGENYLKIETLLHLSDDFIEDLERAVRHKKADLLIMGITDRSSIAQVFIGSKTLKMAETKACPVLIIPEKATFNEVKNVLLASDFKNTRTTTPSGPIKDFLSIFRPNFHIVNVDPEHYISITEAHNKEKSDLAEMFEQFKPEFYFMRLSDVEDAINLFADEKNIDLIITIQRNHTLLEKIFKRSHTKQLSYQSKMPVLVVHE